jgi:aspartyl-tRNA synthetase (EC 6.1.1.12)
MSEPRQVTGWVSNVKILGKIAFIEVIDDLSLTPITIVVKKETNSELWELVSKVKLGSALKIEGKEPQQVVSKKGRELHAEEVQILAEPQDLLPIDVTGKTPASFDDYINYRYLALRLPKIRAVFVARSIIFQEVRNFLTSRDFLEVNTPKIVKAGAEGGATLFSVDYFGEKAFLAQSPQLYKQMLMCGVPRVFEVGPFFRAEKFSTTRHLNEGWGLDVEMGFINNVNDLLSLLEELVTHVNKRLVESMGDQLKSLGFNIIEDMKQFPRVTYDEALKILNSNGFDLKWGEDFDPKAEKFLGEYFQQQGTPAYFITEYPWDSKPFYIMRNGPQKSYAFDLDIRGIEIASGGQREHRYSELYRNLVDKGLDPNDFKFYLDAFKYGMPPHGGFGLGLDRLVMVLLGLQNIREAVLFPRDRFRLVP